MSQLKIIKASAGSGKTFSLARAYLRVVINEENPDYFHHILAVTFTNKATIEMKDRIVNELQRLAYGQKSEHLNFLIKSTRKTEEEIRGRAFNGMERILHGYSWFRVETIDSFFQSIIRNFIRELNIPGYYSIELDQNKVLTEAQDRFLGNLDENSKVTDWLIEYIESKIEDGKSWDLEKGLAELGSHLFKEELIDSMPAIQPVIEDIERLKAFSDKLYAIKNSFESEMMNEAKLILDSMESLGFVAGDFYSGGSGTISFFKKILDKKFELPGSRLQTLMETPSKWPSKECTRKTEVEKFGTEAINPAAQRIIEIYQKGIKNYNTALSVIRNLHLLGMLSYLSKNLTELKSEKGWFLISDAAPFIKRIINNNDAPFIYEKAGTHFHHLLIDEFQDTSKMQWENFKPLISNSLSYNYDCQLVGDIKQSVYRWRNSKWEIMAHGVKNDFPEENIYIQNLEVNWRSDARIINFNNVLFNHIPELFAGADDNASVNVSGISELYDEVIQEIPDWKKNKNEGYIHVRFFKKEKEPGDKEEIYQELLIRINEVLKKGFQPGDITILIRNRVEGVELSDFLIKSNKEKAFVTEVGVVSNESLFLNQSPAVNLLISAMQFVYNPDDMLNAAALLATYIQINKQKGPVGDAFSSGIFNKNLLDKFITDDFTSICSDLRKEGLYNLAERLSQILNINNLSDEKVYLHSFLDLVYEYSVKENADIKGFIEFWNEKGSTRSVNSSESPGSIRIMTIHKSKGLEFPVVIIPFADWSITPQTNEILWVASEVNPYDLLPLMPVNYTNSLAESYFSKEYQDEKYHSLIDNINLLYVALTRPVNSLILFSRVSKEGIKKVGDILAKALQDIHHSNEIEEMTFIESENRYILGALEHKVDEINQDSGIEMVSHDYVIKIPDIRISSQAYPLISHSRADAIEYGKVLHAILERIKVAEDLPNAIKYFQLSGILTMETTREVENVLMSALQNPLAAEWFDGKNKILTEAEIIGAAGHSKRPDRVIIKGGEVQIVDYKFTGFEQLEQHKKQVKGYMQIMHAMGYKKIRGFVWYVLENRIEEVTE